MKKIIEECSFCNTLLDETQICPTCHANYNGIDYKEEEDGDW